jgi:thiol:disulfide interchange protein DsbD
MRKFYSKGVLGCLALLLLVFWFPNSVDSQNPAKWSLRFEGEKSSFNSGDTAKAILRADLEEGWHLYAMEQPPGGPIATTIKIPKDSEYTIAGPISSGDSISQFDSNFNIETKFFKNNAEFNVPLEFAATVDREKIELDVRFQLCTDKLCLPPQTVRVSTAGARPLKGTGASSVSAQNSTAAPTNQIITRQSDSNDLTGFIWLALSLGALSLLTPCVFPMIPITVSYFTNHAGKSKAKAVKLATIYSIGIISTFTLLGMLIAIFVGAAGINLFAANPWVNLLIAAIFLFFAFNLFGAYELGVPTSILTRLDALTRTKEGEGSGIVGALLMGLTFTLTSFTCTSPFVGTILVSASQGSWQMPLIGMFAFSAVFALPFFVLALAPQFVSQMPKAGGWMNSVKVTMGFLEIAAAMKFISNIDVVWKVGFFTRDVVLAVWVSIGAILTVYLLGWFQLHHDSKAEKVGSFRLISAIVSLAVTVFLLTGLFGARLGELESFLPPDLEDSRSSVSSKNSEASNWIKNDLEKAKQLARSEGKRVFIDFTGYTCTNCRWMEANVFPKAEVDEQLNRFVLVKLFTDGIGAEYENQQKFQEETFKTVALPFYAVVEADGRIIATFPGLTRDVKEFAEFLKKAADA